MVKKVGTTLNDVRNIDCGVACWRATSYRAVQIVTPCYRSVEIMDSQCEDWNYVSLFLDVFLA